MDNQSLSKQQKIINNRKELCSLFKRYLQLSNEAEKLSWKSFTTKDGLPHNWIYDIYQDTVGNIWVGTWGGER